VIRIVQFRAEETDVFAWEECAKKANVTLSEFIRRQCETERKRIFPPSKHSHAVDSLSSPKRKTYRRRIPRQLENTQEKASARETFPISASKKKRTGAEELPIERQGSRKRHPKGSKLIERDRKIAQRMGHRYRCQCFACERMRQFLHGV
jgi:hypothetical protein